MSGKKQEFNIDKYRKVIPMVIVLAMIILVISVITGEADSNRGVHGQSGTISNPNLPQKSPIKYDKQMLAVVKGMDTEKKSVTLLDTDSYEEKVLYYNGTTDINDRHNQDITMPQVVIGEIVDVFYLVDNSIVTLDISKDAWEYKKVGNLVINNDKKMMTISERNYQYNENLVVASEGKLLQLIDLSDKDELTLKGIGNKVSSIIVTKGHGYVRFANYSDFIGGNLEIGNDNMIEVSKDMLVVVREGDYKITMDNGDLVGSKLIHVTRDQELKVDMGEFRKKAAEEGKIEFTIFPEGAELYINDTMVDYSEPITLEYGDYTVSVKLESFQDYVGKIRVDASSMQFFISLAQENISTDSKDSNKNDDNINNNTNNSNNSNNTNNTNNSTNNSNSNGMNSNSSDQSLQDEVDQTGTSNNKVDGDHKIYVQSPSGASVYWNGQLMGTAPVNFTKQVGSYTVSLATDGKQTVSYPVIIADDNQDVYLNFPALTTKTE